MEDAYLTLDDLLLTTMQKSSLVSLGFQGRITVVLTDIFLNGIVSEFPHLSFPTFDIRICDRPHARIVAALL